ncbi:hypothetical protein HUJ05_002192 [Dendroctonus ponderosae]|nr:hypothetical protein HUJ05_002192 [Dendroctonus ponderosae]
MPLKPRVTPKELMEHLKHSKIFDRVTKKVNFLSFENGNGLAEFSVEEEHTNSMGQLHTGFYKTQTKIGDEVQVRAKTLRADKSVAFLEIALKNKTTDSLIATGNHDMFILRPRTSTAHYSARLEEHANQANVAGDGS